MVGGRLTGESVKNVAYAYRKIGHAEGLRDELHALIEPSVMDNRIACVACRKEHLQIRFGASRLGGDLSASHASREDDVSEQQIDPELTLQ